MEYYDTGARKKWAVFQANDHDRPKEELKTKFHMWCQTHNNGFNEFGEYVPLGCKSV